MSAAQRPAHNRLRQLLVASPLSCSDRETTTNSAESDDECESDCVERSTTTAFTASDDSRRQTRRLTTGRLIRVSQGLSVSYLLDAGDPRYRLTDPVSL